MPPTLLHNMFLRSKSKTAYRVISINAQEFTQKGLNGERIYLLWIRIFVVVLCFCFVLFERWEKGNHDLTVNYCS